MPMTRWTLPPSRSQTGRSKLCRLTIAIALALPACSLIAPKDDPNSCRINGDVVSSGTHLVDEDPATDDQCYVCNGAGGGDAELAWAFAAIGTPCGQCDARAVNCQCDGEGNCEAAEVCNGVDDDGDGSRDDGLPCVMNEQITCADGEAEPCHPLTCTTGCGTEGTGTCTAECETPAAENCGAPETCNGCDDDGDTQADTPTFVCVRGQGVECTTTCGSTGIGVCTDECNTPEPRFCTPPVELCNLLDDDCDTQTDDPPFACTRGETVGCATPCGSAGVGICSPTCEIPTGDACTATETCNGLDDDCDSAHLPDNGFPCIRGATVTCTTTCGTSGSGVCTPGCEVPTGSACRPPDEACNGRDDDCDTVADDGFECALGSSPMPCITECGSAGTHSCMGTCVYGACVPPGEICNGVDDDCDGAADVGPGTGFDCRRGQVLTASSFSCSGTRTCSDVCTWFPWDLDEWATLIDGGSAGGGPTVLPNSTCVDLGGMDQNDEVDRVMLCAEVGHALVLYDDSGCTGGTWCLPGTGYEQDVTIPSSVDDSATTFRWEAGCP